MAQVRQKKCTTDDRKVLRSKAEVSSCLQCVSSKEEPLPACEQVADENNDRDQWQWLIIQGYSGFVEKFTPWYLTNQWTDPQTILGGNST